ncbi:SRPBCC family protein [Jannaschia donghaensis]|nr:SRPBCC domain-containing protein [Jannaschia donghaensis]
MQVFTVRRSRRFAQRPSRVFDAWLDPALRAQFETPEGSGMSHVTLATQEGESGEILIAPGDTEVGRMFDTIRILQPGRLAVVHGWGVFGGNPAMTMQNVFDVTPDGDGCTFTGTSQMVVLGEQPTEADVARGWDDMLDRFAGVLERTSQED